MKNCYTDIYGKTHYIKEELSRGGQGVVYKTQDPNILIKIELNEDKNEVTEPSGAYDNIRILPLPKGIHLSLPLATLKDASGYVMYLLDDMVPLGKFFSDKTKDDDERANNEYLSRFKDNDFVQDMARYIATGANRVRLEAFFKLACILAQLHANGLVYGDISENNIFISNYNDNVVVWLIDSDNVNFQEITKEKNFGTLGYFAPELINPVKRKGNTFYSDSYSFSIALFKQLTGKYPFMGRYFDDHADEFEYVEDREAKAYSGTLPWILDEDDLSNAADTVPSSDLVISKDIKSLFRRTFSKMGRESRETRPSMMEWAYFLGKEVDNTIVCHSCHMGYNPAYNKTCPWCDSKNSFISIKSYKNESLVWSYNKELELNKLYNLPSRCVKGLCVKKIEETVFSYKYDGTKLVMNYLYDDCDLYLFENDGWKLCYGEISIKTNGRIKGEKNNSGDADFVLEVAVL